MAPEALQSIMASWFAADFGARFVISEAGSWQRLRILRKLPWLYLPLSHSSSVKLKGPSTLRTRSLKELPLSHVHSLFVQLPWQEGGQDFLRHLGRNVSGGLAKTSARIDTCVKLRVLASSVFAIEPS